MEKETEIERERYRLVGSEGTKDKLRERRPKKISTHRVYLIHRRIYLIPPKGSTCNCNLYARILVHNL